MVEVSEWTEARTGIHYSEIFAELVSCGIEQVYVFQQGNLVPAQVDEKAPFPVNRNVLFSRKVI